MWRKRITTSENSTNFMKLFGPAWLVMMADMDASSIMGAAQTGAIYNYGLIWVLILLIIPLYVIQETSGRIGIATGKGLGEVIRENFSKKVSLLMTLPMAITDAITYTIEYMAIAIGFEILGIPIGISIPLIFLLHIIVVSTRKYVHAEKILIGISLALILGLISTLALRGIKPYSPFYIEPSPTFFFLVAANVGAVIMPFMLYFQASATAIKLHEVRCELKNEALKHMRRETLVGAIVTEVLMVIVEMTFSGIKKASESSIFVSASQLATVLEPIAGKYSPIFFAIGLISAGFLALVVISLGSAWGIIEALGVPKRNAWKIYVLESIPAVLVTLLIPSNILINAVLDLLVFFVFALVGPILTLGVISRNKKIMGELYTSRPREVAYWLSAGIILSIGILASIKGFS